MERIVTAASVIRQRTEYALRHPAPLVVNRGVAVVLARLDAHGHDVIDWNTIRPARPDDQRWDEPPPRTERPRGAGHVSRSRGAPVAYAHAVITRAYDDVALARDGERNIALNRAAYAYGRLVGADLLTELHATAALEDAAERCGLLVREARLTIRSGLRAGARRPLEK
jgi:hypothetical protein